MLHIVDMSMPSSSIQQTWLTEQRRSAARPGHLLFAFPRPTQPGEAHESQNRHQKKTKKKQELTELERQSRLWEREGGGAEEERERERERESGEGEESNIIF